MKLINKIFQRNKNENSQKWQIVAFIFITAFAFDQITKYFIKSTMEVGQVIEVIGSFFKVTYVLNNGVAFGAFQGNFIITYIFPIVMVFVFIYFMKIYQDKRFYLFTFTFMLAGTLGNFSDRIFNNSYVIDFISFNFFGYEYPSFNFADIYVVVSIFVLLIEAFITSKKTQKEKNGKK